MKFVVVCFRPPQFKTSHQEISRSSCVVMVKKCTKKCNARAELLFGLLSLLFVRRSRCRRTGTPHFSCTKFWRSCFQYFAVTYISWEAGDGFLQFKRSI